MFLSVAVLAAIEAKAGIFGYALVVAIGSLLGVANFWTLYTLGDVLDARLSHSPESLRERDFRALYLAMFLWIFGAGFLGLWLTSSALHLLARG